MKVRETLYYAVSRVLSPVIQHNVLIRLFSLFSFPNHSKALLNSGLKRWLWRYGLLIFAATFLLLFGVNAVWSLLRVRALADFNPSTRNYFEDLPNLVNYVLIGPALATLCVAFLVHIRGLRSALEATGVAHALELKDFQHNVSPLKYVAASLAVVFANVFAISLFMAELPRYQFLFWFQDISISGDEVLSTHGYYYLTTNLLLNLMAIMTVAAHFEFFAISTVVGRRIELLTKSDERPETVFLEQKEVVRMFLPFSSMYLLSKTILVVLIANMYMWRAQRPDFTGMLDLTIVVLALFAFAVVSYPRYHIQYWVFRLWQRHAIEKYPELRPPLAVGFASLADVVVLGGAMTNLVAYVLDKSGVKLTLF